MLSNAQILALALNELGGSVRAVDTEDIAMEASRLTPGRFAWKKYQDQISLELVRRSLTGDKQSGQPLLIAGSHAKGWSLTTEGKKWVDNLPPNTINQLQSITSRKSNRGGGIEEEKMRRELKRIENTEAWMKWQNGDIPEIHEVNQIFKIDYYSTKDAKDRKVNRLREIFEGGRVRTFLDVMSDQLTENDQSGEELS